MYNKTEQSQTFNYWEPLENLKKQGPINQFDFSVQASLRYHLQKKLIDTMDKVTIDQNFKSQLECIVDEYELGPGVLKRFEIVLITEKIETLSNFFELKELIRFENINTSEKEIVESLCFLYPKKVKALYWRHVNTYSKKLPSEWKNYPMFKEHICDTHNKIFDLGHKSFLAKFKNLLGKIL